MQRPVAEAANGGWMPSSTLRLRLNVLLFLSLFRTRVIDSEGVPVSVLLVSETSSQGSEAAHMLFLVPRI